MKQIGGGGPSIFEIIESGDVDMIRWRVEVFGEQQNEFNRKNSEGYTPLHVAVTEGDDEVNIEMCELLIEGGADVNLQDNSGNTPLILAILEFDLEMCKFLIESNADVNLQNNRGDTPLHIAARNSEYLPILDIIDLLIQNGANPTIANGNGDTPVDNELVQEFVERHHTEREEREGIDIANFVNELNEYEGSKKYKRKTKKNKRKSKKNKRKSKKSKRKSKKKKSRRTKKSRKSKK